MQKCQKCDCSKILKVRIFLLFLVLNNSKLNIWGVLTVLGVCDFVLSDKTRDLMKSHLAVGYCDGFSNVLLIEKIFVRLIDNYNNL